MGSRGMSLFWVAFAPYDYGFRDHRRICRAPPAAVMFCDLVGSTALSATLDPEDLRSIMTAYHRCCTELVEHNGGFVLY